MLDIGWSEMAVVALVALIVIGPKELPQAMRAASKWVRKARSLAREFQSGVDDMIREADLEDARKAVQTTRNFDVGKAVEETIDPTGDVRDEAKDLETTARFDGEDAGTGDAPERVEASAQDSPAEDAGGGQATVVEHPLKIAPANSIVPPAEDAAPDEAGRDDSSKSA